MVTVETRFSLTPDFPNYEQARAFLRVINGVANLVYRGMFDRIWSQVGNPKETVNWTAPDEWMPKRLAGAELELARKIWQETHQVVNPRYTRGCWFFASKHHLLQITTDDRIEITKLGKEFLDDPEGKLSAHLDRVEGLLNILQIVGEHSPGRRSEILPDYAEFCNNFTNYRAAAVHIASLYDRLVNLIDRDLVKRSGIYYEVTEKGNERLHAYPDLIVGRVITTKRTKIQNQALELTRESRQKLTEYLGNMNPYKFEHLVRLLLEEMGYDNVKVTSRSNDGGVDVIADIELGISSVREVVQVKRRPGSIGRNVLDQLRGSLYRFNAIRGTIITIGSFATGAKNVSFAPNVAPITLIDGEKLLDLLMQYGIGLTKQAVEFYEFDDSKLIQFEDEAAPLVEG